MHDIFINDWKLFVVLRKSIFFPKHLFLVYQLVPRFKATRISLFLGLGVFFRVPREQNCSDWRGSSTLSISSEIMELLHLYLKISESLKELNDRLKSCLHQRDIFTFF